MKETYVSAATRLLVSHGDNMIRNTHKYLERLLASGAPSRKACLSSSTVLCPSKRMFNCTTNDTSLCTWHIRIFSAPSRQTYCLIAHACVTALQHGLYLQCCSFLCPPL